MEYKTTPPQSKPLALRVELSNSLCSKIRRLRKIALWQFRKIASELEVPLSTVFSICQQPSTPHRPRMGRPLVITPTIRKLLVEHATASQQNRRKILLEIAEDLGVSVNERILRKAFADEGYHRRVARVKPFLSITAKVQRLAWADNIHDWSIEDFQKVIWTDECGFNVGGFVGNTWVTRKPGEAYVEDCLVPKFQKLQTIMVWGCIYGTDYLTTLTKLC
jgi:hypothetical protein